MRALAAADILRDGLDAVGGDKELIGAGVLNRDEVAPHAVLHQPLNPEETPDAVLLMHDEVAGGELRIRENGAPRGKAFLLRTDEAPPLGGTARPQSGQNGDAGRGELIAGG